MRWDKEQESIIIVSNIDQHYTSGYELDQPVNLFVKLNNPTTLIIQLHY